MAGKRVPSSGFSLLNFQKVDANTEMKENADGMLNAEFLHQESARLSGGIFSAVFEWTLVLTNNNCAETGS